MKKLTKRIKSYFIPLCLFLTFGMMSCQEDNGIEPAADIDEMSADEEGVQLTPELFNKISKDAYVFTENGRISLAEFHEQKKIELEARAEEKLKANGSSLATESGLQTEALASGFFNGDLLEKQQFRNLGGWTQDWDSNYGWKGKQRDQINSLFNTSDMKSRLGLSHDADAVAHNRAYYGRNYNPTQDRIKRPDVALNWRHYRQFLSTIPDAVQKNSSGNDKIALVLDQVFLNGATELPRSTFTLKMGVSNTVGTSTTSTRTREAGVSVKIPFSSIVDDITLSGKYTIASAVTNSYSNTRTFETTSTVGYTQNSNHLPRADERECRVRVFAMPQGRTDKYRIYSRVKGKFNIMPYRGNFFQEWHSRKEYSDFHGQVFIKSQYRTPYEPSGSVFYSKSPIYADVEEFAPFNTPVIYQSARCVRYNGSVRFSGTWFTPNFTINSLN